MSDAVKPAMSTTTLLDFFAAHAPVDIPAWFKLDGLPPLPQVPPSPRAINLFKTYPAFTAFEKENPEQASELAFYVEEGYEAPSDPTSGTAPPPEIVALYGKVLERYQRLSEEHDRATVDLEIAKNEAAATRYFAWRWHYAEMMFKRRTQVLTGGA